MKIFNSEEYRTCYSKTRYISEETALAVKGFLAEKRGAQLRVYKCPFCSGFHTTKQIYRESGPTESKLPEEPRRRKSFNRPEPKHARERNRGRWKVIKNPNAWQT